MNNDHPSPDNGLDPINENIDDAHVILHTEDSKSGDIMDQETEENSHMLNLPLTTDIKINNLKYITT